MISLHNRVRFILLSGLFFTLFSVGELGATEMLVTGQPFPITEGTDQHGKAFKLEPDTRFVLIGFDMSTGKKANKFLSDKGQSFLDENNAVFMVNIQGMPWIGRKFALPKMKKYKHRIILLDEKGLLDAFPQVKGKVTIFALDAENSIVGISYWDPNNEWNIEENHE